MNKRIGRHTVIMENKISIAETSSVCGPMENKGPLSGSFDYVMDDVYCNQDSWEKAEIALLKKSIEVLIEKRKLDTEKIDYIISGDLLNQNISSTFGLLDFNIPYLGVYGACSTMGEGMGLSAMLIDGGFANIVIASASSHFCSAEKQFRFPLELGNQRTPTSSWTVTGAGASLLTKDGSPPYVTSVTTGKIVDLGVTDVNNMGAAMAPAAAYTIINHLKETGRKSDYYDLIATGDLGIFGRELVIEIAAKNGIDLSVNYIDCGAEIFDRNTQDTHAGGSGCGCSAIVFSGSIYNKLITRRINKFLFVPTGSLHSPTSALQGQTIPGIAHAVSIENEKA